MAEFLPAAEQGELFVCDITKWPVKDDMASMEFPIFSLAKQADTKTRDYRRGAKTVKVIPSSVGSATVFDKDLLLYIASQITEALNQGLPVSRTVHVNSIDFLRGTGRGDGRASFERIIDMLRRLRGTTIETNIPTGKRIQTKGFSLIDDYTVISKKERSAAASAGKSETVERVLSFTVTISEWLFNGLKEFEVLTLDKGYFHLSRSLDRRLYEIARKHCGDQAIWKIGLDLLIEKIGTTRERFKVREDLRQTILANEIPEYRMALDTNGKDEQVVFYTRDSAKLTVELSKSQLHNWFQSLERTENASSWHKQARKKPAIADV